MLKSLRYRLLAWFLAFVLLTAALIVPANLIYQAREKNIGLVTQQIGSLQVEFLKDTKAVNDFLTVEPANTDFFVKGDNPYLNYHISKSAHMLLSLENIGHSVDAGDFRISNNLSDLKLNLGKYNQLFDSLVYLVYKRGYRNFGLEGELFDYGTLLESAGGLNSRDVFRLRKIENAYFFSNDTAAVVNFSRLAAELKKAVAGDEKTAELVDNYTGAFLRLVELDRQTDRKSVV